MSPVLIALIGGTIAMLGWGFGDFIAKTIIDKIGKYSAIAFIQFTTLIFYIPFLFFYSEIPSLSVTFFVQISIFSLFDFIAWFALYKAFEEGKLSIVNPISSSYAILATIISGLFFGEIFTSLKIVAISIVLLGILLTAIDLKELKNGLQLSDLSKGVPFAIMAFTIYGFYIPFWDKFIDGNGWMVTSFIGRLITLIFTITYMLTKKHSINNPFKLGKYMYVLLIAGMLQAVAATGFNWGVNASSQTSITAAVSSSYALVVVLLAYIFLKERISISQYLGVLLIIIGIILIPFV